MEGQVVHVPYEELQAHYTNNSVHVGAYPL